MSNKQNDKTKNEESESRNIYDEIRAEIKEKQALMPSTDAESVLAALSGQPTTKNGENNDKIK